MTEPYAFKLRVARQFTLIGLGLLVFGLCVWQMTRASGPIYVLWAVQLLPLLIFVPGLVRNNPRGYIGFCFILLLYFIKGVEGVFSPARLWIDYLLLSLSVFLFISSMMTSRWLQQEQQSHNKNPSEAVYADRK